MTEKQKIIKEYNLMRKDEIADEIYNFHKSKQEELGKAVRGFHSNSWRIVDTAKFFNLSVGTIGTIIKQYENTETV